MDISKMRTPRRGGAWLSLALAAIFASGAAACARDSGRSLREAGQLPPEVATAALNRHALSTGAYAELDFVPADVELLARVDLAAIAATEPGAQRLLDFMLHAQQPSTWRFLRDSGLHAGHELRAIYLIVGPRTADDEATLIAAVGDIDVARVRAVLEAGGGVPSPGPNGATLYIWSHDDLAPHLGPTLADQHAAVLIETSAAAVAPGLLLFGPPQLVRRALAVRAGEGKRVRDGALVADLLAIDPRVVAWAVARRSEHGALAELAPGLEHGRVSLDLTRIGNGRLEILARFSDDATAAAFAEQLRELAGLAASSSGTTPVGAALARLRDAAAIHVAGDVVTANTAL